jgi:hypothetical protein
VKGVRELTGETFVEVSGASDQEVWANMTRLARKHQVTSISCHYTDEGELRLMVSYV